MHLHPWLILVIAMAGWMTREQSAVVEYLKEENRILRELLGKKRPRLNDNQRRRLAAKGKALGRKLLATCCCIVTPGTILRWHRKLIAKKYDGSANRKPGRPRIASRNESLAVRMASENRTWGYKRIQGALANLGHYERITSAQMQRGAVRQFSLVGALNDQIPTNCFSPEGPSRAIEYLDTMSGARWVQKIERARSGSPVTPLWRPGYLFATRSNREYPMSTR